MNPLFEGRLQQDTHESLRCILTYIQDTVRLLNAYRTSLHRTLVNARLKENAAHASTAPVRSSSSSGIGSDSLGHVQDNSLPALSAGDVVRPSSSVQGFKKSCESKKVCSAKSALDVSTKTGAAGVQKANQMPSSGTTWQSPESKSFGDAARPSPPGQCTGKINGYFSPVARTQPKRLSELTVAAAPVVDFVERLCGGTLARSTKCLECEQVTTRIESFQDLEVVARKESKMDVAGDDENDQQMGWFLAYSF